ncbi:hypothetical protein F5X99DRAFT_407172 [Biscogniauxia marginata]|nr:hypothetical protein F5X99DRAFT_407172 [Biscogniauxia marginata]
MAVNSQNTHQVKGNIAMDQAQQININLACPQTMNGRMVQDIIFTYCGRTSEYEQLGPERKKFLSSLVTPDLLASQAHGGFLPLHESLLKECFHELHAYRREANTDIEDIRKDQYSAFDSLDDDHVGILDRWLRTDAGSDFLLLEGYENMPDLPCSTNLLLETLHCFQKALINPGTRNEISFVYHLCGTGGTLDILMQDLLIQLLESHQDEFHNSDTNHSDYLTIEQFRKVANSQELWRMFMRCINRAGIRKLMIMLDHIEYYSETHNQIQPYNLIEELDSLIQELRGRVTVKVMVTSNCPKIRSNFDGIGACNLWLPHPYHRMKG